MAYTIGFKRPLHVNRYGFDKMEIDQVTEITGNYVHIRIAANSYGKNHSKMYLVTKTETGAKVKRYK